MSKQKGFSLVELMIAAAVLGGLSLVFLNLMKMWTKSSEKAKFDSEILQISNEMNSILSDPVKCMNTFGPSGSKSALSSTVTNINSKFYTVASGLAPSKGYGNAFVSIDSFSINSTVSELATNNAVLTISFLNKNILKGQNTKLRTINLYVQVDASNNITSCHSYGGGGGGGGGTGTDLWTQAGSDIYYNNGNVGVGLNNPSRKLDVKTSGPGYIAEVGDGTRKLNIFSDTNYIGLGSGTTDALRLYVNDNTNTGIAILSSGNVGVGISNPANKFHVVKNDTGAGNVAYFDAQNANNEGLYVNIVNNTISNAIIDARQGGVSKFFVGGDGSVGIGVAAPASKLDVLGDINSSGTIQAVSFQYTSDRNLKENISPINNSTEKILQLRPVKFKWKNNKKDDYGFIAQDVAKVIPEITSTDSKKIMHVDYAKLIPFLVDQVQRQQREINKLKRSIR